MGIGRKLVTWAALAAAAGVILVFALPSYRQGEASIAGTTARDFPLEIAGKPIHLSDFRGKVVSSISGPPGARLASRKRRLSTACRNTSPRATPLS